ncbi:metallopeptidase family protein [Amnibacterium endophyticum]|uniref:Metallopeptidase family protein n=1 Tax=Amnibacterium endophyticum TaxID=2109337 RepID=A0ABW4LHC6_9MICO
MPVHLSLDEFETLVERELDALPSEMTDGLENLVFVVEDEPEDGEELLGRYEGVDLTQRGQYGFGELPDRIVLFRLAHLRSAETLDDLRDEVHTTLVHEIGHFYGLDDDRLHELGWA